MANPPENQPNYHHLPVSMRAEWHLAQREYLRLFDYYSCEDVDYGDMKAAVRQFIMDKLEELSMDNSDDAAHDARFFLFCMANYETNLDLCMDIYLLDSMWHFGEHVEADRIQWYIMYKYGPY